MIKISVNNVKQDINYLIMNVNYNVIKYKTVLNVIIIINVLNVSKILN